MNETFSEFWEKPEQEELRSACAKGWAERVWNAALAAAPAQPAAQGEVRKARCISMRPGMGEVTLRMDNGRVPGFMDPGHEVFVLEAHPEPAAPAQPEVQRLREALEVRAEFEAWANGRCELHLVNSAGRYSSATTQFAWEAYQAGRAALGAQRPEELPSGARPTVASTVPTPLSDDDRNTLHQLAFELGGTEGGEYWLDAESLDKVIDAALSAQGEGGADDEQ